MDKIERKSVWLMPNCWIMHKEKYWKLQETKGKFNEW